RGIDFYVSFTAAPPRLKRRRVSERDPIFRRYLLGSLTFTAFLLWLLFRVEVRQNVEIEELPDRIATILYQPEKFTSYIQPKPKPTSKPEVKATQTAVVKPKPKAPPKKVILDIKPNQEKKLKEIPKQLEMTKQATAKKE